LEEGKERYAFLWRQEALRALGGGAMLSDESDLLIREPYFASFRAGQFDFLLPIVLRALVALAH